MYRTFKIAHLLGLALFLGSVLSHIVASALGGAPGGPDFLAARAEIVAATRALTLPGLGLALVSGLGMAVAAPELRRRRWLWLHGALATLILASSVAFVVPAGQEALQGARALADGGAATVALGHALILERVAGAVNIWLAIAVIVIGVIRPALRARS